MNMRKCIILTNDSHNQFKFLLLKIIFNLCAVFLSQRISFRAE